jgi:[acyl-carrier-protein] S-malonyltransferase
MKCCIWQLKIVKFNVKLLYRTSREDKKDSYMSAKRLDQVVQATKTAFVFPGQGSQKVGMLAEIAEQFSGVQNTFAEASEALGFDLWQIAQTGEGLDQTENTQPVLLTASVALWRTWLDLGGVALNIWQVTR